MHMTACPYCGSQRTRKWYTYEGDSVNRCSKCDLVFRGCSGDEIAWEEYYRKHYFQDFGEEQEGPGRLVIYGETLDAIDHLVPKGPFFDIGAGSGTLLAMARNRGWTVSGQEISSGSCRLARERYGLELIQEDLKALHLPSETYCAVTMVNILDHLAEPWPLLEKIHRALKPGGVLYIRVPNGSLHSLGLRISDAVLYPPLKEKIQKFFVIHRYHITPRFIRKALGRCGFETVIVRPSVASRGVPYRHFNRDERRVLLALKKVVLPFARALCRVSAGEVMLSPSISIYGIKG
ncbi:MAG: class I SAM-dependent methyltransferase [Deltaproteobacteria bacterium]|nr:class I SAM-dependent methyltransferase [Deltaproteobacteria bacterium]